VDLPIKCRNFQKKQDGGGRRLEKSQKSRYFCNGLTDLYEIWYADAKWVSHPLQSLKYFISRIQDG